MRICSSTAGRSVVEAVLNSREEALAERSGGDAARLRAFRPQLPVIPLPLPDCAMGVPALDKKRARKALDLPENASIVLWLGRLSTYKASPWPTYAILERVAETIILLFCWSGPDDKPSQEAALLGLESVVLMCTSSEWAVRSQ